MRCSAWSSLAISVCSALLLAPSAAGHVTPTPSFITADATTSLRLSGPNERGEPMTAFVVTVPDGFRISQAGSDESWQVKVEGTIATWSGGSLASASEATFTLAIVSPPDPGAVTLEAEQLYAGGAAVRWPIALTVVPGNGRHEFWIYDPLGPPLFPFFALLGLIVLGFILVRRKRRRSLQEK